ncbi:hypothetical protein LJB98_03955 [Bacteroidales bacterium OttesenSCG-928-M11]|nr:hypothetical protein [Bacteroidales bacterium OttesenSCG-928-M11]
MKKKIYLLLFLLGLGGLNAFSQYEYSIEVKTNTGEEIAVNSYVSIVETILEDGTRVKYKTRTKSATRTRERTRSWIFWGSWSISDTNWNNGSGWGEYGDWSGYDEGEYGDWNWDTLVSSDYEFGFGDIPYSDIQEGSSSDSTSDVSEPVTSSVVDTYYNSSGVEISSSNNATRHVQTQTRTITETTMEVQSGSKITVNSDTEWYFTPVPYTIDEDAETGAITSIGEPGWYYIENVLSGTYLVLDENNVPILSNDNSGDGGRWRLIKVAVDGVTDGDNNYFKLVSKKGSNPSSGGGRLLARDENKKLISTDDYTFANSVFQLSAVGDFIVKNDDQEIVSNYLAVSGVSLTGDATYKMDESETGTSYGSQTVWSNLPPNMTINGTWNRETAYLNPLMPNYNFAPIGYEGTDSSQTMYSFYASGNTIGDGFYFARLSGKENDNSFG